MAYNETEILIAYAAGMDAAARNASRAPAMSSVIQQMLANSGETEIGSAIPVLKAFTLGYQDQCDAEAAAILAA